MPQEQTHIYRQKIIGTETYKKITFIQRKMVSCRNNVKVVENALKIIGNVGFAQWESQANPNYTNKLIIEEINLKK